MCAGCRGCRRHRLRPEAPRVPDPRRAVAGRAEVVQQHAVQRAGERPRQPPGDRAAALCIWPGMPGSTGSRALPKRPAGNRDASARRPGVIATARPSYGSSVIAVSACRQPRWPAPGRRPRARAAAAPCGDAGAAQPEVGDQVVAGGAQAAGVGGDPAFQRLAGQRRHA